MIVLAAAVSAWPATVHAGGVSAGPSTECLPSTRSFTVASGGSMTLSLQDCSIFGTDALYVAPAHGSVPEIDPDHGGGDDPFHYINNGDGATSDTFVVLDDQNGAVTYNVTILPASSPITVTPANLPTPVIGTAYSQTLSSSGGVAPYTYSATGLPPGLTLSSSGVISGTPTGFGPFNIVVTIHDSTTPTALTTTKNYGVTIALPVLAVTQPPAATVGLAYSQQLAISGGTAPYHNFAVSSGALPAGLSLSATGLISGTPSSTTSAAFQVLVYDSSSGIAPFFGYVTVTVPVNPAPTITLSPATLNAMTVGAPFNQTITPTGGTAPYAYSVTAGALPAGVSLGASTGLLSGTPTAGGSYSFTISVHDAGAGTGSRAYSGTVQAPTIAVAPASLTPAMQNTAYSATLSASGGTAPYTYAVTAGALPAGLNLAANGVVSGTPTVSGSFNFTITATDSSGGTGPYAGTRPYTLVVNAAVPVISPTTLPAPAIGTPYSQTLSATGGTAPYTFAVSSGALPAGLTLSSTGALSGTPKAAGSFTFTVQATDAASVTGTQNYTFAIAAPTIALTPATLPAATLHAAYNQTVTASGGTAPYAFTVSVGALPTGLTLSTTGVISGTPSSVGTYNFTVSATDSTTGTGPFAGNRSYSIVVSAPTISVAPPTLPNGQVGAPYSQTMTASGGTGPYSFAVTAGALPAGITLGSGGTLSGTPTQGGSQSITITATDANGDTGSTNLTLVINAASITVSPITLPAGNVGSSYSQAISASGGTAPYAFAVSSGALPTGMTLASDGSLSGTPAAAGSFSFTVAATDSSTGSGPYTGTRTYTWTVGAPVLAIAPAAGTLNAGYATAFSQTFSGAGGTTPYTFAESGTLPSGISWNAATGTLSGTPTQPGSFPITITLTDSTTGTGSPYSTSSNYTLVVSAAVITIAPASLPNGAIGSAYPSTQLTASGGQAPYTYSISAGALPAGMSLGGSGAISGTPTSAGTFNFTVSAQDANGFSGTRTYSITVGAATLTLNPANLPAATAEAAYSQTLAGSGGTLPYTYAIAAGALPAGMSLNASSGLLSGTPSVSGSFTFTAQVTDSSTGVGAPFTASRNYTLTVNAPTISMTPATLPNPQAGIAYSQQLAASGGNGTYTFVISGGALPAGLSLNASGLLGGTPTAAGSFTFTVQATDGLGFTGTQSFTLTVSAASLTLVPTTLPAATAESAYSQSFSASGGTAPYIYTVSSGSLPAGLSLGSSGTLGGTPTASGSFTFTVRVADSSTGTGAPFTASRSYTLVVNAPGISVSPGSLPNPQAGAAYSQQLTASGGNGTYTFAITVGALPGGLTLGTSGLLSGTPSAAGSFSFTVTARDGLGFTGAQAYSVSVGQPRPVAVDDSASTAANSPTTIPVTVNDTGPITSIAIGHAPGHGNASISGLNVVYTPTANYYGSDSLTYTATGPGGTSAAATVTITVAPLSVPTAAPQAATVLAGKPVTIHAATGATGGPFTGAAIVTAPSEGTTVVTGTDIVFTPPVTASGKITFTYSLSNAFGTSAPATVTVTVNAVPVAPSRNVNAIAGVPVLVDLTAGSSGGPFTAAAVVSVSPANLGSASIVATNGGYQLRFEPTATANGSVTVSYTLSNAFATSAPGAITIAIAPRSDPSKDAEVLGLLGAQTEAMRRFATGQIDNFQQRLESMHGQGEGGGQFANGITLTPSVVRNPDGTLAAGGNVRPGSSVDERRYLVDPVPDAPTTSRTTVPGLPSNMAVWTGGAIDFGSRDPRAGSSGNGFNFNTSGLSGGVDYRVNADFAFGAGIGYGHDDSAIGHNGSHSAGNSYSMALYGSYHPSTMTYLDGLAGYQTMSFDSRRFVTDDGSYLSGRRHADQFFASLSAGYDYRHDKFHLSPYGRVDIASGTLKGYTEHGDSIYALSYRKEAVKTTTGNLGLRLDYQYAVSSGVFSPMLRLEYQHDFQGTTTAALSYADLLSGPLYRASVVGLSQDRMLIGIGGSLQTWEGLDLRFEYSSQFGTGSESDQSIMFNLQKKF